MTNPVNNTDKVEETAPATAERPPLGQPKATGPVNTDNKNYVVSTSWQVDSLEGENFPTVTPQGVGMNEQEKDAALAAANEQLIRLSVEEVN